MLCSKPEVTNSVIGKTIPKIFPIVLSAPKDIHTARHTSQLHSIPSINALPKERDVLPAPIFTVIAPSISPPDENSPVWFISHAISSAPARFPAYTMTQFLSIAVTLTFFSSTPQSMSVFPVKSSAPASTTIMSPAEKITPARILPSP